MICTTYQLTLFIRVFHLNSLIRLLGIVGGKTFAGDPGLNLIYSNGESRHTIFLFVWSFANALQRMSLWPHVMMPNVVVLIVDHSRYDINRGPIAA